MNDFQTAIDMFLYRLKILHCQTLHDIKEMTRVERSIREIMKNPIQAMDYLSMPGCHYLSHIRRKKMEIKEAMEILEKDIHTDVPKVAISAKKHDAAV